MATSKAQVIAALRYKAKAYKQIPLDMAEIMTDRQYAAFEWRGRTLLCCF